MASFDDLTASVNQATAALSNSGAYVVASADSRKGRKYNEKMYKRQRQDALADYERALRDQLRISDPAFQMQRFKNAGINPYLAFSSGSGSSGSSVSPVRASTPGSFVPSQSPSMLLGASSNIIQQMLDYKVTASQLKNLDAQTDAQLIQNRVLAQSLDLDLREQTERINSLIEGRKLTEAQVSSLRQQIGLDFQRCQAEVAKYLSDIDLQGKQKDKLSAEIANLALTGELTHAQVSKVMQDFQIDRTKLADDLLNSQSLRSVNNATLSRVASELTINEKQADKIVAEIVKTQLESALLYGEVGYQDTDKYMQYLVNSSDIVSKIFNLFGKGRKK